MAIRLSKAFGSMPGTWLAMQMASDLWQAPRSRRGGRGGTLCVGGELEASRDHIA